jgi:hypothetical protein
MQQMSLYKSVENEGYRRFRELIPALRAEIATSSSSIPSVQDEDSCLSEFIKSRINA